MKNIIFDFDGTLADTSRLIVSTMQKSIKDLELPLRDEAQIKATIGVRLEEIPSILWPSMRGIGEKFAQSYRKNFEELKNEVSIDLFSGVKVTLSKLLESGYKMAIATSRSNRSAEELTKLLGIRDYFLYLLGGDNVKEGKPHPESILKILEDLNWEGHETLMVGDTSVDILMAKNAGIKTCAVTYGNGKESDLKKVGADFIISDFNKLMDILTC